MEMGEIGGVWRERMKKENKMIKIKGKLGKIIGIDII